MRNKKEPDESESTSQESAGDDGESAGKGKRGDESAPVPRSYTPPPTVSQGRQYQVQVLEGSLPESLLVATRATWTEPNRTQEERVAFVEKLAERFDARVRGFIDYTNWCQDLTLRYENDHKRWRRRVIMFTGILATLNFLAAAGAFTGALGEGLNPVWTWSFVVLTGLAAVWAVVLTVTANLENLNNSLEKAQSYREARELFLDAARKFNQAWIAHIDPFNLDPESCINATELYRRINERDQDLRRKLRELSRTWGGAI